MRIRFIGAAMEVTGSCTLLEVGGKYYLIDCGMEQGIDVFQNVDLPVLAGDISAVFLTHAHIDHSGMLPKLYKNGFRGDIYSTTATAKLCDIMLRDSAHIQMMESEWKNRKAKRKDETASEPTYDLDDAIGAISLFKGVDYGKKIFIDPCVEIRFTDIGHLLGSAAIEIWLKEGANHKKIVFSGDVGNYNQPIINDPKPVDTADYLVLESTYGNRVHGSPDDTVKELAKHIERTLSRGGNVVIPSFAVGRTQELLYAIREIKGKGLVADTKFPVYIDSPLAIEATRIFSSCSRECFDEQTNALIDKGVDPIKFNGLKLSVTSDESKNINLDLTPKVIISASGMCEAGRIRHHLKHNLWRRESLVLFVGYQAVGSLGRVLVDGADKVDLFGEEIAVRAEIRSLKGLSGHADKDGLLDWLNKFSQKPRTVFINHGDESSVNSFAEELKNRGYAVEKPCSGTEYDLVKGIMTEFAECKRIKRGEDKGKARKQAVLEGLVSSAEALVALTKRSGGMTNKDKAKFASEIRALINKWEK